MSRPQLIRLLVFLLVLVALVLAYQATRQFERESDRALYGMILFIGGGIILGFMVALFIIPAVGDRIAGFFYNAPEKAAPEAGSKARALVAQGQYTEALDAYLEFAKDQPENRLPVAEAMRLAREKLHNPVQAILIAREALANRKWPPDDEAFFLFRLVELHDEDLSQRSDAIAILRDVAARFPGTRHAANATHKLKDWGVA